MSSASDQIPRNYRFVNKGIFSMSINHRQLRPCATWKQTEVSGFWVVLFVESAHGRSCGHHWSLNALRPDGGRARDCEKGKCELNILQAF
jgi:hypothetical protein